VGSNPARGARTEYMAVNHNKPLYLARRGLLFFVVEVSRTTMPLGMLGAGDVSIHLAGLPLS